MTSNDTIFQSDVDNKWYFWREAWQAVAGPFDEYVQAHEALSEYLRELDDDEEGG